MLFAGLTDRFTTFARLRVKDPEACLETVQDALAVIVEKYRDVQIETSFAAWAYRVLENKILQYYRAAKTGRDRYVSLDAGVGDSVAVEIDPERRRRLLDCLRQIVNATPRYARILNLHYQGFTVTEICEKMETTRGAAYSLLSRGRVKLRDCLEKRKPSE